MGGEQSYLGQMILHNEEPKKIEETIALLRTIFSDENVYLELIAQYENKLKNLKKVNPIIKELAEKTSTPLIVNTNYHYVHDDNKEVAEVAMAIKDGKQIYDDERRKVVGDFYITSEEELKEMMINKNGYEASLVETMLTNNQLLADRINIEIPLGNILFPNYSSDEEIAKLYNTHQEQLIEK